MGRNAPPPCRAEEGAPLPLPPLPPPLPHSQPPPPLPLLNPPYAPHMLHSLSTTPPMNTFVLTIIFRRQRRPRWIPPSTHRSSALRAGHRWSIIMVSVILCAAGRPTTWASPSTHPTKIHKRTTTNKVNPPTTAPNTHTHVTPAHPTHLHTHKQAQAACDELFDCPSITERVEKWSVAKLSFLYEMLFVTQSSGIHSQMRTRERGQVRTVVMKSN